VAAVSRCSLARARKSPKHGLIALIGICGQQSPDTDGSLGAESARSPVTR
jgi:hypothetical protein